jgi:hypothetical protein
MSLEPCKLCNQDSTPWVHINGHICEDCYIRPKWIDFTKQKPEHDGRYLVSEMHMYQWVGISSMRNGKFDMEITHWMELPAKPEIL